MADGGKLEEVGRPVTTVSFEPGSQNNLQMVAVPLRHSRAYDATVSFALRLRLKHKNRASGDSGGNVCVWSYRGRGMTTLLAKYRSSAACTSHADCEARRSGHSTRRSYSVAVGRPAQKDARGTFLIGQAPTASRGSPWVRTASRAARWTRATGRSRRAV